MWFSRESTPLPTRSQLDRTQAHGCTIFMGGHSMNRSLDLGMMTNTGFRSPQETAPNS
jgi:hypothetical protein